jgi:hypothetical protein
MRRRCDNRSHPQYMYYGGRGITFCAAWRGTDGFRTFLQDVGRRPSSKHSIDRTDNSGNYTPGNVRWATRKTQNRNSRRNRYITAFGETHTLSAWAERTNLHRVVIAARLKAGWPLERALTEASTGKRKEPLMRKGTTVTHWTPANDATIAKMRAAGSTWAQVAKAVSTRTSKRSAAATMQRWRYTEGLQKKKARKRTGTKPPKRTRTEKRDVLGALYGAKTPASGKSVTVGGQTFSMPEV